MKTNKEIAADIISMCKAEKKLHSLPEIHLGHAEYFIEQALEAKDKHLLQAQSPAFHMAMTRLNEAQAVIAKFQQEIKILKGKL